MKPSVALKVAAAATALLSTAALATASLTINGNSAAGFVERSDVQSAFGFNDSTMQRYAASVIFNYSDHLSITYTCDSTKTQYALATQVQDLARSGTLGNNFASNGWNVSGSLKLSGGGSMKGVPQVGDSCPGAASAVVTSVDVVESNPTLTVSIPSKGMRYLDTSGIVVE